MVASDRISVFDVVLDDPIPDKGRALTALSAFWFGQTAAVAPTIWCPPRRATSGGASEDLAGRAMLVARRARSDSNASRAATSSARPGTSMT